MKHTLPNHIANLLEQWDNLGFSCKREAAEFILANSDWNLLVKDTEMKPADVRAVDEWRKGIWGGEEVWSKQLLKTFNTINNDT